MYLGFAEDNVRVRGGVLVDVGFVDDEENVPRLADRHAAHASHLFKSLIDGFSLNSLSFKLHKKDMIHDD